MRRVTNQIKEVKQGSKTRSRLATTPNDSDQRIENRGEPGDTGGPWSSKKATAGKTMGD
jgi:hypothetical protein